MLWPLPRGVDRGLLVRFVFALYFPYMVIIEKQIHDDVFSIPCRSITAMTTPFTHAGEARSPRAARGNDVQVGDARNSLFSDVCANTHASGSLKQGSELSGLRAWNPWQVREKDRLQRHKRSGYALRCSNAAP